MKAKLYKGSQHGKTINIDPSRFWYGITMVRRFPPPASWFDTEKYAPEATIEKEQYRPVMMNIVIDGVNYRAPAMHPDGSVFLVKKD